MGSLASPLPTIELCIGAVAVFALLNVAVMGFLAPVPPWWGWMGLISYMRWAFGAFMINQFEDLDVDICEDQPANTMVNWTALANADMANINVSPNDIGDLLCSSLQALETVQNNDLNSLILGNTTTGFPGVCPESPALGSAPTWSPSPARRSRRTARQSGTPSRQVSSRTRSRSALRTSPGTSWAGTRWVMATTPSASSPSSASGNAWGTSSSSSLPSWSSTGRPASSRSSS